MPRPKAPEPYTGHNIYLYASQLEALRKAASERRMSISQVVRELIDEFLS